jgi:hypothetical protein
MGLRKLPDDFRKTFNRLRKLPDGFRKTFNRFRKLPEGFQKTFHLRVWGRCPRFWFVVRGRK